MSLNAKFFSIVLALAFSSTGFGITVSLDFEDGLLPSSHGWIRDVRELGPPNEPTHTVINGAVPGVGGNSILQSSGTSVYGWFFVLDGLVGPNDDWVFSMDMQHVNDPSGVGVGIHRFGEGIDSQVISETINDSDWHNLRLEMNQTDGVINGFIDGTPAFVHLLNPLDVSGNGPAGVSEGLLFAFANNTHTSTANFDNIFFESTAPRNGAVPEPVTTSMCLMGLGALSFKLRRRVA